MTTRRMAMPWKELALRSAWKTAAHMVREKLPEARRAVVQGSDSLLKALRRRGFICTTWNAFQRGGASAEAGFELAVCALQLHGCSEPHRLQRMSELRPLSPYILLLDWQGPERNLDLPAVALERFLFRLGADVEKRRNRCDYEGKGSLEGVLYRARRDLTIVERRSCLGGCLGMALIRWNH